MMSEESYYARMARNWRTKQMDEQPISQNVPDERPEPLASDSYTDVKSVPNMYNRGK